MARQQRHGDSRACGLIAGEPRVRDPMLIEPEAELFLALSVAWADQKQGDATLLVGLKR